MTNDLDNWKPCEVPGAETLTGQYAVLRPYNRSAHLETLYTATCNDTLWTYIPVGPFQNASALGEVLEFTEANRGWKTMVIEVAGRVLGMASFMRIRAEHGSAEVGCVVFGPELQRTAAASEAIYLMGQHLFDDLGYRRYEWKCNNANEASRRAALRFGFRFEGVFRNDMVMKGQSRDTAWYAMTDKDWSDVKHRFGDWLSPGNFDQDGRQLSRLRAGESF